MKPRPVSPITCPHHHFLLHSFEIPLLYLAHFSFVTQFGALFPWEIFSHPFSTVPTLTMSSPYPGGLKVLSFTPSKEMACDTCEWNWVCMSPSSLQAIHLPVVDSPWCSSQHVPGVPDTQQVFPNFWVVWSEPQVCWAPHLSRLRPCTGLTVVEGACVSHSWELTQVQMEQLKREGGKDI